MSQIVGRGQPTLRRQQLASARRLLGFACVAIVTAIVVGALLMRSQHHPSWSATHAGENSLARTVDLGARLDHRGLHDAAYLSALAETGARLDHRGLRTASDAAAAS